MPSRPNMKKEQLVKHRVNDPEKEKISRAAKYIEASNESDAYRKMHLAMAEMVLSIMEGRRDSDDLDLSLLIMKNGPKVRLFDDLRAFNR